MWYGLLQRIEKIKKARKMQIREAKSIKGRIRKSKIKSLVLWQFFDLSRKRCNGGVCMWLARWLLRIWVSVGWLLMERLCGVNV